MLLLLLLLLSLLLSLPLIRNIDVLLDPRLQITQTLFQARYLLLLLFKSLLPLLAQIADRPPEFVGLGARRLLVGFRPRRGSVVPVVPVLGVLMSKVSISSMASMKPAASVITGNVRATLHVVPSDVSSCRPLVLRGRCVVVGLEVGLPGTNVALPLTTMLLVEVSTSADAPLADVFPTTPVAGSVACLPSAVLLLHAAAALDLHVLLPAYGIRQGCKTKGEFCVVGL
ncbi:hypothetical protein BC567DRAFT_16777 [Phyllosticta citribraziliensis]